MQGTLDVDPRWPVVPSAVLAFGLPPDPFRFIANLVYAIHVVGTAPGGSAARSVEARPKLATVEDDVAALRALELVGTAGFEGDIPGPKIEVILVPVYQVELRRIVVEQYPVEVEERALRPAAAHHVGFLSLGSGYSPGYTRRKPSELSRLQENGASAYRSELCHGFRLSV